MSFDAACCRSLGVHTGPQDDSNAAWQQQFGAYVRDLLNGPLHTILVGSWTPGHGSPFRLERLVLQFTSVGFNCATADLQNRTAFPHFVVVLDQALAHAVGFRTDSFMLHILGLLELRQHINRLASLIGDFAASCLCIRVHGIDLFPGSDSDITNTGYAGQRLVTELEDFAADISRDVSAMVSYLGRNLAEPAFYTGNAHRLLHIIHDLLDEDFRPERFGLPADAPGDFPVNFLLERSDDSQSVAGSMDSY